MAYITARQHRAELTCRLGWDGEKEARARQWATAAWPVLAHCARVHLPLEFTRSRSRRGSRLSGSLAVAIAEAFQSGGHHRRHLHVVDLDVSYDFQWPSLI
uniref:Uncharacterized protein n=1 Tax=Zea mays TaxID=4577 RepID=A0A804PJL7_MAIZE